ncbi:winged helix-turn-helix transcriptional regulator [Methanosarcina sp. MSH10X1]|uniref:winged helix-turn-helix transcriptional regulator n=1 Tax=Methanosarcina sp. MSH10X1 TaxID=2507075 RepID=UPI000FFB4BDD|nr:winged helix-turn-helix transcriptional regulator [Methanosarcina sp. MSH10X1]RXA14731.1 winged helix-turn-helix transcriptional regulator [Methanosarcina sp. MSH10X1]
MSISIKLQKKLIACLLFFILIITAGATEYTVEPAPSDQSGASISGEKVIKLEDMVIPYWQFLLWLAAVHISTAADLLYPKRLVLTIGGYRIVKPGNVLDNSSRFRVYGYIKTKPGAYIGEIVEKLGLNRETVKYHIKTLEAQNKIEAYKKGGKTRFFENNFAYDNEEMKVISALQNVTNQRIISEILAGNCNTNISLARELGVSRATVSWYMKNLREADLIMETNEGRKTIYRISHVHKLLVEKYIKCLQDSYSNECM